MNTEILAARAKEGDADAFAALIWDHMQSMYKVARSILMLYYIEDFKTAEIGRILDIPETTVRTRLARGRKRLVAIYRGEEMERRSI